MHLYEVTSKTLWENRLYYSSVGPSDFSDSFNSTVGISPSSTDALLLVLTRPVAKFQSMQDLHRRASMIVTSIEINELITKSRSVDEHFSQTHSHNHGTLPKISGRKILSFDPLEQIETSLNTKMENIGPAISPSHGDWVNKYETTNNIKPGLTSTFSASMSTMTSHSLQSYDGKRSRRLTTVAWQSLPRLKASVETREDSLLYSSKISLVYENSRIGFKIWNLKNGSPHPTGNAW